MEDAPDDAYVPFREVVTVRGTRIEFLKTLADCTGTFVYYRPDRSGPSRILFPRPIWPPEIGYGGGTGGGDVLEARFGPVDPNRTEIRIEFVGMPDDEGSDGVISVPVDRGRTARYDRTLMDRPPSEHVDGVDLEVVDARIGARSGEIDLAVRTDDTTVRALEVGFPRMNFHHGRPFDDDPLLTDWRPKESGGRTTTERRGDMTVVSISASFTATATKRVGPRRDRRPAPPNAPEPPDPVAVVELPSGAARAASEHPMRATHAIGHVDKLSRITFPRLSDGATGVRVTVSGIYVFREIARQIVEVPLPPEGHDLDLQGASFETPDGPIDLLGWRWDANVLPRLEFRAPHAFWYPHLRVIHGEASAGLWIRPGPEGTLAGGLPAMFSEAFTGRSVKLGIRLLGKPAPQVGFDLAFEAAGR
ncbi:MAG: hypothetical protein ACRDJ1_11010 [Actinomycetota bacterium]